jgi:hypothetical protein
LGAESATGVGVPVAEVTHWIPSVPEAIVDTHPAGRVGALTPSKFSLNGVFTTLVEAEALPEPLPLPVVNEAVFIRVEPHVRLFVELIT